MGESLQFMAYGELDAHDKPLVQLLLEIGKAPLGWRGEFELSFLLTTSSSELLPAGVAMYIPPMTEWNSWHARVTSQTIVLLVAPSQEGVDIFAPTGASLFATRSHAERTSLLNLGGVRFSVAETSKDLLDAIYQQDERGAEVS